MSMFKNRHDAGKRLADKLKEYKEKKDVVVLDAEEYNKLIEQIEFLKGL